jgi:hypothetical protein
MLDQGHSFVPEIASIDLKGETDIIIAHLSRDLAFPLTKMTSLIVWLIDPDSDYAGSLGAEGGFTIAPGLFQ